MLAVGLCAIIAICAAGQAAAQGIGATREFDAGVRVAAPPPIPPGTPDNLRFVVTQPSQVETQLELQWDEAANARGYRVYRRLEPVAALPGGAVPALPPSLAEGLTSPFGWQEIAQIADDGASQFHFIDSDIPPPDPEQPVSVRRRLGLPHCYKVEAHNADGMTESDTICKRLRGINAPSNLRGEGLSPSSIKISWRDRSAFEWGFKLYYRRHYETGYNVFWYNTANGGSYEIKNLASDMEYCVAVASFDYYGESARQNEICGVNTLPEPDAEPEEHTFTVQLQRQIVNEGPIPYVGAFPTNGGMSPAGNLTEVRSSPWNPTLYFVKPGKSTADCNDPEAVVALEAGDTMPADDMETLYGSASPELPIVFLACAAPTAPLLNTIPINISYTKDE